MKSTYGFKRIFIGCLFLVISLQAQEDKMPLEKSAAVFLEDYSDSFQEEFFEGLKQKGIENYDKAIVHFLNCKSIDPQSTVVTHQLAKVSLLNKEYVNAKNYALEALNSQPENLWYLHTLVQTHQKQGGSIANLIKSMPYENIVLRKNLSKIYYKQENYKASLAALEGIKNTKEIQRLYAKIAQALKKQEAEKASFATGVKSHSAEKTRTKADQGVQGYTTRIKGLLSIESYATVKQVTKEAIEQYPLQPYFYYVQGLANNKTKNYRQALETLEQSLDYLIDDISLANKIYKEMANACTGLHQTSRANMYLRKIKSGF